MAQNKNLSAIPDFDYPETVAKNADAKLSSALHNGNGADVVRYLVQSSLAKSMITTDNAQSIIERVDSVAQCEKSPQYRALLYFFEAKMLNNYYSRYRYKISQRLSTEASTSIDEWSEDQFSARITNLLDKATTDTKALAAMSIDELGDLIIKDHYSHIVYPSLLDVLAWNSINIIEEFADDDAQAARLVTKLLADIISAHSSDYAPLINAKVYQKSLAETLSIYREYAHRTDMSFLAIDGVNELSNKEQFDIYADFLNRYSESVFADNVKQLKLKLETREVNVKFADRIASSSPIVIDCNVSNATDFTVYVMQLPDDVESAYAFRGKWSQLPIRRYKSIHCDGVVPFSDTVKVELPALPYGRYMVYCDPDSKSGPSVYDKLKSVPRHNLGTFFVSDIMLFSTATRENETRVFAVDALSGAPLKGVTITVTEGNQALVTGADGSVLLEKKNLKKVKYSSCDIFASRGNDRLTKMAVNFVSKYLSSENSAHIFTDLAVYHPGDKVQFAAVYHSRSVDNVRSIIAGTKLKVTFSDANYEDIDSLYATTDEFGRIEGSFIVPRNRMNGTFHFALATADDEDNEFCSKDIEVSDYKVPTFYVETTTPNLFEKGKDAVISGRAMFYNGMPVADARLEAKLSEQEWSWWRFSGDKDFISSFTATTGADGSFSITIPAELLNTPDAAYRFSQFVVDIDVTSAAGETQSASASFRTGQFCSISLKGSHDMCFNAEKEILLPVEVRSTDATAGITCQYTIADSQGNTLASGSFDSAKPVLSGIEGLPSGKYKLTVTGPHDAKLNTDVTFFRPGDNLPPVESPLWIPDCENVVDDNNHVSILLGNSNADSHIYCIAATSKKVLTDGWMKLKPGLHRINFDIPKDENEFIDITFITICNGKSYRKHFNHKSKYRPADISIKPIVFRDNLVPGAPERWSLQLIDARGNIVQGAMICEMMDNAINQIKNNSWDMTLSPRYYNIVWSRIMNNGSNSASFTKYANSGKLNPVSVSLPELQTYGVNIFYPTFNHAYGRRMRLMSKSANVVENDGGDFIVCESAVAAPGAVMEEAVAMAPDAADAAGQNLDKLQVRTADVQTALWRPSLRTDADGNIFIDFTAPDFCTTWLMQAVAYTSDLHTARFVKEVLTSKPVMVRANMPRFVRQGDKVQIAASIMNASDSTQQCTALVEIFNINTGDILTERKINLSLAARETQPVTIDWAVPDTLACVGYRVRVATSQFGDGEQHALVILPSISPVVETLPFFIDADKKDFELKLPKFSKGSRVTLEYSDNPVWYCVTALPSIVSDDNITSTSIAHSLYALLVARGIAVSSPEIREAVDYWLAHEADSTLVSNLAKNGELKINTLLASPWLREADRQTLRMHSISNLFDDALNKKSADKLIKKLADMQMDDGGFTWVTYRNCTSSFYATHTILQLLGEVRRLGYLSPGTNLDKMLNRAIAYYDAEQLRIVNEHIGKFDYNSLSDYVYTRSLYPDMPMLDAMKPVHSKALAAMRTGWKGLSLPAKAYFAMALHRNGDKATPAKILRSLREFSITKPETGMYWDNLRIGWDCFFSKTAITTTMLSAFSEIEPQSPDIDLIRKWVLLDKQANDWGSSSMASAAINAILSSGSKWLG
ncbi:MAG: alpha-2-macroglobulin family protein, partial [Muribaculaceae bacterium]